MKTHAKCLVRMVHVFGKMIADAADAVFFATVMGTWPFWTIKDSRLQSGPRF